MNPVLKDEYVVELIGSSEENISGLVERIISHEYTGNYQVQNEYRFNIERHGNLLNVRLIITIDDELRSHSVSDARIRAAKFHDDPDEFANFQDEFNSCPVQMLFTVINDEDHPDRDHEMPNYTFCVSPRDNTGVTEMIESMTDRIIQMEHVHQNYSANDNILDFSNESFATFFPCMLIDYKATTVIMPRSLTGLSSHAFYGMRNPFNAVLTHMNLETIECSVFKSTKVHSINFPRTLKTIMPGNFLNCDHFD